MSEQKNKRQYVIYHPGRNVFSIGGYYTDEYIWNTEGKKWTSIANINHHLAKHLKPDGTYSESMEYPTPIPNFKMSKHYDGSEQIFELTTKTFVCTVKDRVDYIINRRRTLFLKARYPHMFRGKGRPKQKKKELKAPVVEWQTRKS